MVMTIPTNITGIIHAMVRLMQFDWDHPNELQYRRAT
jgi:hypothetical protein